MESPVGNVQIFKGQNESNQNVKTNLESTTGNVQTHKHTQKSSFKTLFGA